MRDELLRILKKDGWNEEDLEMLQLIFEGPLERALSRVSPDIAELALKKLAFKKGKKVLRESARILGLQESDLQEFFNALKGKKTRRRPEKVIFEDLIEEAKNIPIWDIPLNFAEDLKTAAELSKDFKNELYLNSHPYVYSVATKPWKPLVLDGSNFLWKHDLCPAYLEDLFLEFSSQSFVFFPVYMVFDANVRFIIPKSGLKKLEEILSSRYSFLHSPADELIISLSREKDAVIMSEDRFREYDFKGKVIPYPL
jgi:hypothetical protein